MYADAPNYDEERGLTIPRVNMLLEQGSRRRVRDRRFAAEAFRVAQNEGKIEEAIPMPPERRLGDGTPTAPERDTSPWWED